MRGDPIAGSTPVLKDSPPAEKFETVAERVPAVLTEETKEAILTIKNSVPEGTKIMGIELCQAVIKDGIGTYAGFPAWREYQKNDVIILWQP